MRVYPNPPRPPVPTKATGSGVMPRFRIDAAPIPARRFKLPEGEHSTAPAPLPELGKPFKLHEWGPGLATETRKRPVAAQTPKRTVKQPVAAQTPPKRRGEAQAQRTTTPKPRATTHQAFETFAPDMDTKPLARLTLAVASEEAMPGIFGDLVLHCAPEAHNMRRLSLGTMSLLRQHSDDDPVGRVLSLQHVQDRTGAWSIFGEAEIADIPLGAATLAEVRAGARLGVSPAFLMEEIDFDDDFNMQITQSEVYECSLVTGPRFYGARVLGTNMQEDSSMSLSMNGDMKGVGDIVTTSDVIGLSLVAAKKALASGQGSAAQRAKLQQFFKLFQAGLENGLSRDKAAQAAKTVSGIA